MYISKFQRKHFPADNDLACVYYLVRFFIWRRRFPWQMDDIDIIRICSSCFLIDNLGSVCTCCIIGFTQRIFTSWTVCFLQGESVDRLRTSVCVVPTNFISFSNNSWTGKIRHVISYVKHHSLCVDSFLQSEVCSFIRVRVILHSDETEDNIMRITRFLNVFVDDNHSNFKTIDGDIPSNHIFRVKSFKCNTYFLFLSGTTDLRKIDYYCGASMLCARD